MLLQLKCRSCGAFIVLQVNLTLTNRVTIDYKVYEDTPVAEGEDRDWNWEDTRFTQEDLKQIDPTAGKFVFVNAAGDRVTLNRVKEKQFHYYDAF